MIWLDDSLPPGALCAARGVLAADLSESGALWWAGSGLVADATGTVTGWRSDPLGALAVPTEPNTGNGQIGEAGDLTGLLCRDGLHCGLVAMDVVPDAGHVTLAARYLPPWGAEAKTILTLNTGGGAKKREGENYLYLSEAEGRITVKDDTGLVEAHLPAPSQDAPRLVLLSMAGTRLSVALLGGPEVTATASGPVLSGMGHLFIGCRNQRPGLTKTLGGALISDIWAWPGRALLGGDAPEERAALLAMRRFWLWSEGE